LNTTICLTDVQIKCAVNLRMRKLQTAKFYELCPLECSNFVYKLDISASRFPSRFYAQHLYDQKVFDFVEPLYGRNITVQEISLSISQLNIYYSDLSYTKIQESIALTLTDLFSNIGGLLSLCLGISFLSVVDMIQLFTKIMNNLKMKCTKENNIEDTFVVRV
jgi:hypothetical protein